VHSFCRWGRGGWSVAAKLELEDATGRLDALLLGPAGAELLGIAPCDLERSPDARFRVEAALARLSYVAADGAGADGEGAAWMEVVISSAYSSGAAAEVDEAEAAAAAAAATAAAAAVAAAATAAAAAAGGRTGAGGEPAGPTSAAALAARAACVYVIHDTFLVAAS
jgi:hypothetical protein